jgi:hypothetical protein
MDNFEWNKGLSVRFGLLRTDFKTQQRSWKKSAFWYRDVIDRNWLEAPAENDEAVRSTAAPEKQFQEELLLA